MTEMPSTEITEPVLLDSQSCELLRAVARRSTEASTRELKRLAANISDWDLLLKHACAHHILPRLFIRLQRAEAIIPAEIQQRLQAEYERNYLQCLANATELIGLLKAFERSGIEAMPFKGIALAASVYGEMSARSCGDLDILIHYRDLYRATAILLDNGYRLLTPVREDGSPSLPYYYEFSFNRQGDGMTIELRWRLELLPLRFRSCLGLDWARLGCRSALVGGVEVPSMGPERTLLMLCMHGSKHTWSRLLWISDVAQLIDHECDLNWDGAIREARRSGLWHSLALGVLLAYHIADAEVPYKILRQFESHSGCSLLVRHFTENLFNAPGSLPEGLIPYNFRLLDTRDRLLSLFTLNLLRPNERDFAIVNLPRQLRALYWLVRPLRLLVDRSARW